MLDFATRIAGNWERRMGTPGDRYPRLRFGTFELDLTESQLWRKGVSTRLQDKPFQILRLLVDRPGEIVTREELQKRLWPDGTFVEFDKGLNTAVKKLRQALLDSADSPLYIEPYLAAAIGSSLPSLPTSPTDRMEKLVP